MSHVTFVPAQHTFKELNASMQAATDQMVAGKGPGANFTDVNIDESSNSVVASAPESAPTDLQAKVKTSLPGVVLRTDGATWEPQASRDRATGPVYGGEWISNKNTSCTAGYSNARVGTKRVTLTAGHCGDRVPFYQGHHAEGVYLGGIVKTGYSNGGSSKCDCAAIGTIDAD